MCVLYYVVYVCYVLCVCVGYSEHVYICASMREVSVSLCLCVHAILCMSLLGAGCEAIINTMV